MWFEYISKYEQKLIIKIIFLSKIITIFGKNYY